MSRGTEGGFNRGRLSIEGSGKFSESTLGIEFQNKNYVAFFIKSNGTRDILATVPDLILVDEDTGEPVATEEVRYGLRVAVIAMPCFPRVPPRRDWLLAVRWLLGFTMLLTVPSLLTMKSTFLSQVTLEIN